MKLNIRILCRTALLLALCIASQFLKNTSVYITGSIINAILIITVLSCGLLSGVILSVLTPLTSWLITGSPLMSAIPLLMPSIMLGNIILVVFVWLFARWLQKRTPKSQRIKTNEAQFRLVLLVGLVAAVLWAGICVSFLASLANTLQIGLSTSLILTILGCSVGVFLFFGLLWVLCCRFPKVWLLVAGGVLGSVVKAGVMWSIIVKILLPAHFSSLGKAVPAPVALQFSIAQLITALIGSVLAVLIWMPLSKAIKQSASTLLTRKSQELPANEVNHESTGN